MAVYLIRENENVDEGNNIHKLGYSPHGDMKRFPKFPKKSKVVLCLGVDESPLNVLQAAFSSRFESVSDTEFAGNSDDMVAEILENLVGTESNVSKLKADLVRAEQEIVNARAEKNDAMESAKKAEADAASARESAKKAEAAIKEAEKERADKAIAEAVAQVVIAEKERADKAIAEAVAQVVVSEEARADKAIAKMSAHRQDNILDVFFSEELRVDLEPETVLTKPTQEPIQEPETVQRPALIQRPAQRPAPAQRPIQEPEPVQKPVHAKSGRQALIDKAYFAVHVKIKTALSSSLDISKAVTKNGLNIVVNSSASPPAGTVNIDGFINDISHYGVKAKKGRLSADHYVEYCRIHNKMLSVSKEGKAYLALDKTSRLKIIVSRAKTIPQAEFNITLSKCSGSSRRKHVYPR